MSGPHVRTSRFAWTFVLAGMAMVLLGNIPCQAAEPQALLSERILPADAVLAVFLRNGDDTEARWRQTALYELTETPAADCKRLREPKPWMMV